MTHPLVQRLARALSYAFHPLFMPLYTLYLAINADINIGYLMTEEMRQVVYLMVGIMTVIFPLLSAFLLIRSNMISSLSMPNKEERILPFTMTLFYFGLCYFLLQNAPLHEALYAMMTGAMIALAITILITFRWKISVHMVGLGGAAGAMVGLMLIHDVAIGPLIALLIVLVGFVGSARLALRAHSPAQVYAGVMLGGTVVCASVFFGLAI